jgi:putative DNA primase/helicase
MHHLVAGGELDRTHARDALLAAGRAMTSFDPRRPWTAGDVVRIVDAGLTDGLKTPRRASSRLGGMGMADPLARELAILDPSDTGNAARLRRRFGENLLYVVGIGWCTWDSSCWRPDTMGQAMRWAQETAARIADEGEFITDGKAQAERRKWSISSGNESRIEGMLAMAAPHVTVAAGELDQDPWLLNVANGTLDLRTGALRSHHREDRITKRVPIAFDPGAACPAWEKFLDDIFLRDPELIGFIQRAIGYSLTGDTREECLFLAHGNGANGKSTFVEIVAALAGDYANKAQSSLLMDGGDRKGNASGPSEHIARLHGARFVSASETRKNERLDENLVKAVTGRDTITARFLNKGSFEFMPQFKVWLATNNKPVVLGTDNGIWRRLRLIPFEARFLDPAVDPVKPGGPVQDKDLRRKLMAELPGILAWAVRGGLAWQRDGLKAPAKVLAATAQYRADEDRLSRFLEDCVVAVPAGGGVTPTDMYVAYSGWCQTNAEDPLAKDKFRRALDERGYKQDRTKAGRYWDGTQLKPEVQAGMRMW